MIFAGYSWIIFIQAYPAMLNFTFISITLILALSQIGSILGNLNC